MPCVFRIVPTRLFKVLKQLNKLRTSFPGSLMPHPQLLERQRKDSAGGVSQELGDDTYVIEGRGGLVGILFMLSLREK